MYFIFRGKVDKLHVYVRIQLPQIPWAGDCIQLTHEQIGEAHLVTKARGKKFQTEIGEVLDGETLEKLTKALCENTWRVTDLRGKVQGERTPLEIRVKKA